MTELVKDMRDAPPTQPTSRGGNHARIDKVAREISGAGGVAVTAHADAVIDHHLPTDPFHHREKE